MDIKPNIRFNAIDGDSNFVSVAAEPLPKGFGITIGNSLRRVLLSSIEGAAVVGVTFSCAKYEFCTIPHVYEEVQAIVANISKMPISLTGVPITQLHKMKLSIGEKRDYTSDDIEANGAAICTDSLHILTVTDADIEPFTIDIYVSTGTGYIAADMHDPSSDVDIFVDTSFSPILNVQYSIDNVRVGGITDYDKLLLEVKTNGAISPSLAVMQASKILLEQFAIFAGDIGDIAGIERDLNASEAISTKSSIESDNSVDKKYLMLIEDMNLSIRSENCIRSEGIKYVGDLVQRRESDMLSISNFGRKSLVEIKAVLDKMGLYFGMYIENWPPKQIKK